MTTSVLRPATVAGTALGRLIPGAPGVVVTGVSLNSRSVVPGDLYVALPGRATHGARFVGQAVAAGAVAVLTDEEGSRLATGASVPVVAVDDPRRTMAGVAAELYGRPAGRVRLFGVTGTNGKTSTVFLLQAALEACGERVATIGTLGFRLGAEALPVTRTTVTTPESPDLQALLAVFAERGATSIAMEVSSHALALGRVEALTFDVAAFTMLGRDHLDFHPTLEDYYQAKARLFTGGRSRVSVVNVDDPAGRRLIETLADEGSRVVTTSIDGEADYRVTRTVVLPDGGSRVTAATPAGELSFAVGMIGAFNVRNALTALAMAGEAGMDVHRSATGFAAANVPGRMQRIDLGPGAPAVIVDFAHTPQAVQAALAALPEARRIVVLGCGGDRDPLKRGPMGQAAAQGADVVLVTDDNPRSEDPAAIRRAVLDGARQARAPRAAEIVDAGDRRTAIAEALRRARPGDFVAVLGKGHETGQIIGDRVVPFDDGATVKELWEEGR